MPAWLPLLASLSPASSCPASRCHCVRRINFYAFLIYVQKQKNNNTNKLRDVSSCARVCVLSVCVRVCVLKMHLQEEETQVSCCNFKEADLAAAQARAITLMIMATSRAEGGGWGTASGNRAPAGHTCTASGKGGGGGGGDCLRSPLKVLQCRHTHFSSSCHACRPLTHTHT